MKTCFFILFFWTFSGVFASEGCEKEVARNRLGFIENRYTDGEADNLGLPIHIDHLNIASIERQILSVLMANPLRFFGARSIQEVEFPIHRMGDWDEDPVVTVYFLVKVHGFVVNESYVKVEIDRKTRKLVAFCSQLTHPERPPEVLLPENIATRISKEKAEARARRLLTIVTQIRSGREHEQSLRRIGFYYNYRTEKWRLAYSFLAEESTLPTNRYRIQADAISGELIGISPATEPADRG